MNIFILSLSINVVVAIFCVICTSKEEQNVVTQDSAMPQNVEVIQAQQPNIETCREIFLQSTDWSTLLINLRNFDLENFFFNFLGLLYYDKLGGLICFSLSFPVWFYLLKPLIGNIPLLFGINEDIFEGPTKIVEDVKELQQPKPTDGGEKKKKKLNKSKNTKSLISEVSAVPTPLVCPLKPEFSKKNLGCLDNMDEKQLIKLLPTLQDLQLSLESFKRGELDLDYVSDILVDMLVRIPEEQKISYQLQINNNLVPYLYVDIYSKELSFKDKEELRDVFVQYQKSMMDRGFLITHKECDLEWLKGYLADPKLVISPNVEKVLGKDYYVGEVKK